ncbi:MAG: phosphonate metabolism transcriptional regulator PhnF [Pseudomonadota bacterium]
MSQQTWTAIRDALAEDIANGTLEPGDRLATEPQLAERFRAGRHSVRRAVEALAKEGKLSVEQGRGTFVEAAPLLTYAIGKRTRLRRNLLPQGVEVGGELLEASLIPAEGRVREALRLEQGAGVIQSRRLTLADDVPIAFGVIYHDAARFADIVERRERLVSLTEVYRSYGIEDYLRGETTLHARPAKAEEAKTLRQHPDMPVIVVRSIDTELDGTPLAFAQVIWSAARVMFTMGRDDD